jgi:hypothetical protein
MTIPTSAKDQSDSDAPQGKRHRLKAEFRTVDAMWNTRSLCGKQKSQACADLLGVRAVLVKCCRGVLHSNHNFKALQSRQSGFFAPGRGKSPGGLPAWPNQHGKKAAAENAAALIDSTVVEARLLVLVAAVTRRGS